MKLSTSTNLLYERRDGSRIPVSDSIRLCAQAGYVDLDFCFVDQIFGMTSFVGNSWREHMAAIRDQALQLGISFSQSHGPLYDFCRGEDPWQEELLIRCLEGSRMLGVPWMVMHPMTKVVDGHFDDRTMDRNVAFFRRLSDLAGRYGVGIAMENMWGRTPEGVERFAKRPEELLDLLSRIQAENVGICWDTEHGSVEGLDQGRSIRSIGVHLKATHISDQTSAQNAHILPYTGTTDWDAVLDALADVRYEGSFAFEMQHYLLAMPEPLLPSAVRLSRDVGVYLVDRFNQLILQKAEKSLFPGETHSSR